MSERRLLQIIADESRGLGAPTLLVSQKYGTGLKDTFYRLLRRGDVEGAGTIALTKQGANALRCGSV